MNLSTLEELRKAIEARSPVDQAHACAIDMALQLLRSGVLREQWPKALLLVLQMLEVVLPVSMISNSTQEHRQIDSPATGPFS